ncbi:MAG: hypothetical protein JWO09_1360 [Bacteroidetes bacterium]|nr:hypothetical protein [Bacteroidota bacterium]
MGFRWLKISGLAGVLIIAKNRDFISENDYFSENLLLQDGNFRFDIEAHI